MLQPEIFLNNTNVCVKFKIPFSGVNSGLQLLYSKEHEFFGNFYIKQI